MTQPNILTVPFARDAGGSYINEIPEAPVSSEPQRASLTMGFPPITMQQLALGGLPPQGQDFNGIFNLLSEHIVFQNKGGIYKFSSEVVAAGGYDKGALVLSGDGNTLYVSLQDGNTQSPSAGSTQWTSLYTQGSNATTAQAQALTADNVLITPKKLGDAMNAHVLGMGQTWQEVTRVSSVAYTNTTGRTIAVSAHSSKSEASQGQRAAVAVDVGGDIIGQSISWFSGPVPSAAVSATVFVLIPPGATYSIQDSSTGGGFSFQVWELR